MEKIYISNSPDDTKKIAKEIIIKLINENLNKISKQDQKNNKDNKNKVINIILNGDLAAGKTKFVEGILEIFNIEKEISSPTFTIVNEYLNNAYFNLKNINENIDEDIKISINHFDVYRLQDEEEFFESGLKDYLYESKEDIKINLIEWGMEIESVFPKPFYIIDIQKDIKNENKRIIKKLERY